MAFKLKGGVGGPFRKNYPSVFKHVDMSKPADHSHDSEATAKVSDADYEALDKLNKKEKDSKPSNIQKVQSALTGAELIPDAGPYAAVASSVAGGINAGISLGRSGYHYLKGEKNEGWSNLVDAGLSGAGMIPVLGYSATTTKAAKAAKAAGKYGQARHLDDIAGKGSALNVPEFKDSFFGGAWGYLKNKMKG